jgi:hypothetical protein
VSNNLDAVQAIYEAFGKGDFTIKDFRVLSLMAGGDQVAAGPKRKQNAFGLRNFAGRRAL